LALGSPSPEVTLVGVPRGGSGVAGMVGGVATGVSVFLVGAGRVAATTGAVAGAGMVEFCAMV
jgi:hypothetical protein